MSALTPMVDTLLASRLAQRADLVPLRAQGEVAGPGPVTEIEGVLNDIRLPSREALQQQLGVGLLPSAAHSNSAPTVASDKNVILSDAARAVNTILESQTEVLSRIRGTHPIWPHSPPPTVKLLAASLNATVTTSGLFYESHLQQYAAGTRTLAQLTLEPQAQLGSLAKISAALAAPALASENAESGDAVVSSVPVSSAASAASAAVSESAVELLALSRPATAAPAAATPVNAVISSGVHVDAVGPLPAGVAASLNPIHFAATYGQPDTPASERAATADHAEFQDATSPPATSRFPEAPQQDPGAALIHPEAVAIVRQQLELLALPVFRWSGEVWPGTPMEWEIGQEDEPDQSSAETEIVERSWGTQLKLNLPTLGAVEIHLRLTGSLLQAQLAARVHHTEVLMSGTGAELGQRLTALGLQLDKLQIGAIASRPGTPLASENDTTTQ